MPRSWTVVADVVAWALVHSATGYAAHRLSARRLDREGWLLRSRSFEARGLWYRRWLRIHRWKDRLPEAGALFPGGVSKRTVPGHDPAGLTTFVRETRRAELAHWWAMGGGVVFVGWNPPLASALLLSYGVVVNLPFIAIQRYNRSRAQSLADRRRRSPTC